MVMAGYLKSLGVRKTIALVSSAEFVEIARKIGSDVAIPLKDAVVDTILSHLRGKSVTGIHTISGGDLEILEYLVPEKAPVAGKAVKDIALPGKFLLLMVQKQGAPRCAIPVGDTVIEEGDRLILVSDTAETGRVLSRFGGKAKE
jgi:trk system potassium uptake protein TrkA